MESISPDSTSVAVAAAHRRFVSRRELNQLAEAENSSATSTTAPKITSKPTAEQPAPITATQAGKSLLNPTANVTLATVAESTSPRFFARASLSESSPSEAVSPTVTQAQQAKAAYETASQITPPTAAQPPSEVRRGNFWYNAAATAGDFAQAAAIRSTMTFTRDANGGADAIQVTDEQADILRKTSERYNPSGAAAAGTAIGLTTGNTGTVSESKLNFAFEQRDVASFSLELPGAQLGGSLVDALKSGKLVIEIEKWGGAGNVGENAAKLSLSGRAYNFADFGDGRNGLSLNIREGGNSDPSRPDDVIGGTFGGFTARDGITLTLKSYDSFLQISDAKLRFF